MIYLDDSPAALEWAAKGKERAGVKANAKALSDTGLAKEGEKPGAMT